MSLLREKFASSPEFPRVAPFAMYAVLTYFQGKLSPGSVYWLYVVKTALGAWLVWEIRPFVEEMRWKISWEAVTVGVAGFAIWVGLDGLYPRLSNMPEGSNPFAQYGANSAAAWFYVAVHIAGMSVVVPPVEEIFYRSFLYRYFVKIDFRAMPFSRFHALSFVVTSIVFGLVHPDRWLAGIIFGLGCQWLVVRKGRLGDAISAHAITNFLLGIWIVWKGAWTFW